MPSRYDDRDYDRDSQYFGQYNQRSDSEYGRGYRPRSEYGRDWESERYGNEGRFPGDEDQSRYSSRRSGRGYQSAERGYSEGLSGDYPQQRYNYPTGFRSNERYGERGRDYDREGGRGWWDRASDEVASWFGDEEAERRRRMDDQREHRGRGPKGYRRSDERIKEDVNDRLSDDYYLDASDVEVTVANTEVTLTGTVNNRNDKRRAEDLAESVSGVTNVENRLRVKQHRYGDYENTGTSSRSATSGNISGTPGSTTSSAAAGGRTSGT
jgi:Predicted periplasmic or secreted lipoprotein